MHVHLIEDGCILCVLGIVASSTAQESTLPLGKVPACELTDLAMAEG